MALLKLRRRDTRAVRLPMVCMACGQEATTHIRKTFSWYPPWVGITILVNLIIFLVLALALTKKMTVDVPMCDRHGSYWTRRVLINVGTFFVLMFAVIAGSIGMVQVFGDDAIGFTCLAVGLAILIWVVVLLVIQNSSIRPKEITDNTISLIRVHDDFIEALRVHREQEMDQDVDFPQRRRREYDDEYDVGEPPLRQAPPQHRDAYRDRPDADRPRRRREEEES